MEAASGLQSLVGGNASQPLDTAHDDAVPDGAGSTLPVMLVTSMRFWPSKQMLLGLNSSLSGIVHAWKMASTPVWMHPPCICLDQQYGVLRPEAGRSPAHSKKSVIPPHTDA